MSQINSSRKNRRACESVESDGKNRRALCFAPTGNKARHVRRIVVAGVVLGLAGLGLWLGEGGLRPWDTALLGAGVAGGLMVAVAAPGHMRGKVLLGASSLVVLFATWYVGSHSLAQAFNECVDGGEDIRALLRQYRAERGEYPVNLDALATSIPCGRITRPSVLVYERTAVGYRLSFADWLATHTATESEPFIAHK